jgi:NTP pyrophosphatase (non-canonical NTP hydrolase)
MPSMLSLYQDWIYAKHLSVHPQHEVTTRLSIAAHGITGELGEYCEANGAEESALELGDVISYVMYASALLDYDVEAWLKDEHIQSVETCKNWFRGERAELILSALLAACAFSERVKKRLEHGEAIPRLIGIHLLQSLTWRIAGLSTRCGQSMREILKRNQAKVNARYPDP